MTVRNTIKRSLLVDRAMSLGGARQLLDVLCYALLHNAIAAHHAVAARSPIHGLWAA